MCPPKQAIACRVDPEPYNGRLMSAHHVRPRCPPSGERDDALALLVEEHHAEAFIAEGSVPGVEVHQDPDVTWIVHPGEVWRNAAIMIRFSESAAEDRVDQLIARYRKHGRGVAFWMAPAATPDNLSTVLKRHGLRCKIYFPAMLRALGAAVSRPKMRGLDIRRVESLDEFERTPHPAIGPPTTPLRKKAIERLGVIARTRKPRMIAFVAWLGDTPVGATELFLGSTCAGVHSLNVPAEYQGRGIGSELLEHSCQHAAGAGASQIVLLASSEGRRLYARSGFREVSRFAYWYRSFQRC